MANKEPKTQESGSENPQAQKNNAGGNTNSSTQEKHGPNLQAAWHASSEYGHATEPDGGDLFDETAGTHIYPADIGYTVTSYGDGQPTMAPQHVDAREEEAARNADPDAPNKEVARELGLEVE